MFFSISCNIGNYFLSFSHLIIHPIHEWSWFYRQFQFCFIVSNDETLSSCPFLRIDITRSPRSVTKYFSVPYGLRGSVEKNFVRDQVELVVPFCKKFYQVALIDRTSWSQFSTLEKTKHGRHPILNNLLKRSFPWIAHGSDDRRLQKNLCLYQVAPISPLEQLNSMDLDSRNISFTGLTEVEDDTSDGVLATRFIIGRDFAVTRSSPESCWDRFAIAAEQTVGLKWLMLNKHNKWFHSSRVKFPFGQECQRVGFWCRCILFGFWNPD